MVVKKNFKDLSFLIYGLGLTGQSVVKYFKKNKIKNFQVWDDKNKTLFKSYRTTNLNKSLKNVNFIILSPGISLKNQKLKKN